MATLKYVMNDVESALYKTIEQEGSKAAVQALIRAFAEYSHNMSDLGLKEQSREAYEMADLLRDIITE